MANCSKQRSINFFNFQKKLHKFNLQKSNTYRPRFSFDDNINLDLFNIPMRTNWTIETTFGNRHAKIA